MSSKTQKYEQRLQSNVYIPPHKRQQAVSGGSERGDSSERRRRGREEGGQNSYDSSPRQNQHDGSSRGSSRGRSSGRSNLPINKKNNRWREFDSDSKFQNYDENGLLPRNLSVETELYGDKNGNADVIDFSAYDDIPVKAEGVDTPDPIDSFADLDLDPVLKNSLELSGFSTPTPIQKYAVPIGLSSRDLMACAQTGSGKTAAFLFPIIENILRSEKSNYNPQQSSRFNRRREVTPKALVLAPTRELAMQIHRSALKFTYRSHLKCVCIFGGSSIHKQIYEIQSGCDILVATPGRLIDMLQRDKISLRKAQFCCIDEADKMLDMGFEDQIRMVISEFDMPPVEHRQTLMFSATFPQNIQNLARDFLKDYIFVQVGVLGQTAELVHQRIVFVENEHKRDELEKLLSNIEGRTLVFVATKRSADDLEYYLYHQGYSATSIHGDRSQPEREEALRAFKTGEARVLVATDVAARGLHVDNVSHVINYDLPSNVDAYVHRVGRTGRCGTTGLATAFYNYDNSNICRDLVDILRKSNQEIPLWLEEISHDSFRRRGNKNSGRSGSRRRNNNNYGGRSNNRYNSYNSSYSQQRTSNYSQNYNSYGGNSGGYSRSNWVDDNRNRSDNWW